MAPESNGKYAGDWGVGGKECEVEAIYGAAAVSRKSEYGSRCECVAAAYANEYGRIAGRVDCGCAGACAAGVRESAEVRQDI